MLAELIDSWLIKDNAEQGPYSPGRNPTHSIGHPCLRELVYRRLYPHLAASYSVGQLAKFKLGKEYERIVKRWIENAGIDIDYGQVNVLWESHNISGHIDGAVLLDGFRHVLEIKSTSTYVYNRTNSVEDMISNYGQWGKTEESIETWFRSQPLFSFSYLAQTLLYCAQTDIEKAVIFIINRDNGEYKEIFIDVNDYIGLVDILTWRADLIDLYVSCGELPEPVRIEKKCNLYCQFLGECPVTLYFESNIGAIDDPEFVDMVTQFALLDDSRKEANRLKSKINDRLKMADGSKYDLLAVGKDGLKIECKKTEKKTTFTIITPED